MVAATAGACTNGLMCVHGVRSVGIRGPSVDLHLIGCDLPNSIYALLFWSARQLYWKTTCFGNDRARAWASKFVMFVIACAVCPEGTKRLRCSR